MYILLKDLGTRSHCILFFKENKNCTYSILISHCRVTCDQESSSQDGADAKRSQVRVLMSGHIHPCFVFNLFGKYSNKKKYISFLKCQLSLTRFSVYFVHRPLKLAKVSAEYIEGGGGGCGFGFVWFLSIYFLYWWLIGIKITYRWISYGVVSSSCH